LPILTDVFVQRALEGEYTDAQSPGLILRVQPSTTRLRAGSGVSEARPALLRSWVYRAPRNDKGKRPRIGLGSYPVVGLKEARRKAAEARELVTNGEDPTRAGRVRKQAEVEARTMTFERAVDLYLGEAAHAYKNPKDEMIRTKALRTICAPLNSRAVEEITPRDLAALLKPLRPETGRKTLAAVRAVFDFAAVEMDRRGVSMRNPGSSDLMKAVGYKRPPRAGNVSHPAVAWEEMPSFMSALAEFVTPEARCLEFAISTIARSGAARLARFGDIDLTARVWRCPADDMKDSRHRAGVFVVPLNDIAIGAVEAMRAMNDKRAMPSLFVFADDGEARPVSQDRLTKLTRAMRTAGNWHDPVTKKPFVIHGFRASFRTWVEATGHDRQAAELAMGHKAFGAIEALYIRDDFLGKRRKLLDDWSSYCLGQGAGIIPMHRA
jgi:integrase